MIKPKRVGGFLIAKIHHAAKRIFSKMLKAQGLGSINSAQGRILFVLWQKDGIPISDLARKTALEKSTLTAMLDRLERKGLVHRRRSLEDRRTILISLSPSHAKLEKKFEQVSAEMAELFYKGLSEGECALFDETLKRIYANLEDAEKNARP